MKSSIVHIDAKADKANEVKKCWDMARADARKEKGFLGSFHMTHPQSGKCLAVSLWESEEAAKAFENHPSYQKFINTTKPLCTTAPTREIYDVSGDITEYVSQRKSA